MKSRPAGAVCDHLGSKTTTDRTALHPLKLRLGMGRTLSSLSPAALSAMHNGALSTPRRTAATVAEREHSEIVVLGSGWGALSLAAALDASKFKVTVISPRNYFLFTPLLPSASTGTLEVRSIIEPVRRLLPRMGSRVRTVHYAGNSLIQAEKDAGKCSYDRLVVAVGAENNTFGVKGVKEYGFFLKEVEDARKIRSRIIDCFESAAMGQTEQETDRLLHFVVVGGGPTGVEYAAELRDLLHTDLAPLFPELIKRAKITLVESQAHVLTSFKPDLALYAEKTFSDLGIEMVMGCSVKEVTPTHVLVETVQTQPNKPAASSSVPYGLLVWAAGIGARPVVSKLCASLKAVSEKQNSRRGLVVDAHLRVLGAEDSMFAIGDCAVSGLAPTAQVASQQGKYLAEVLNSGKIAPFQYNHKGSFAYIGDDRAILDLHGHLFAGQLSTLLWRSASLSMLLSPRNKFLVLLDWAKTFLFGRDISRI
eukprot:TRINITY_DN5599_c0_g1_i3.p2 TRINITY_DN5599_c0_g1~~TRINITY_DN5599_c0_g1_i3.p2  ORF type:complete len:479 (+),score=88.81 TRINITY_DN5599_c0_g1_i3:1398-2834(+)